MRGHVESIEREVDECGEFGWAAQLGRRLPKPLQVHHQNVRQGPQPQTLLNFLLRFARRAMPRIVYAKHLRASVQLKQELPQPM